MKESQHDVAVPTVSGAIGPLAILLAISALPGLAGGEGVPRSLNEVLEPIRARHGLPALAGAIVTTEGMQAIGATGVRRAGHGEPVARDDLWHLGSCTKAMTATLVARLVEQGKMQWTTSLGATFPELAKTMDPLWRSVTVEQLLTNRGGAPENLDRDGLWNRLWMHRGATMEARRLLLAGVVKHPPEYAPGSKYSYSNANFAIAGHMAETIAGTAWEELIRREVFEPLGITTAGFGAPGHAGGHADEPWGHEPGNKPKEPGLLADNPVAIGPAGMVHMSLLDWGRFVRAHLLAARGDVVTGTDGKSFLGRESWRKLHTAPAGEPKYAMGWVLLTRSWAKGDESGDSGYVLTHDGSNTFWFCVTWLAPEKGFAALVTSNAGGNGAQKATDDAAWAIIQEWLGR